MNVKKEGNELVIRIPLTTPTLSSTGKSKSVASSHGNVSTGILIDGQPVKVGVNAFIDVPKHLRGLSDAQAREQTRTAAHGAGNTTPAPSSPPAQRPSALATVGSLIGSGAA